MMDTWDGSVLVGWVFGTLFAALLLYAVIRLAVTHAIRSTRMTPPAAPQPPRFTDVEGA